MIVHPAGSRPASRPDPAYFTGDVWMNPVISTDAPSRISSLIVNFEPGARTAWHTHPFGQMLHVLSGAGLICRRGENPQLIKPGDTVWFEPGEEHWHGATAETCMSHLAVQEKDETGSAATWLEPVSEEDYKF